MPVPPEKYRDLDPTVIPAQPGYRVATLGYGHSDAVTKQTLLSEIDAFYLPVIAWLVQPRVIDTPTSQNASDAIVYAVTTEGLVENDDSFLVSPEGVWTQPYVRTFDSEHDAKQHFIDRKLRDQG